MLAVYDCLDEVQLWAHCWWLLSVVNNHVSGFKSTLVSLSKVGHFRGCAHVWWLMLYVLQYRRCGSIYKLSDSLFSADTSLSPFSKSGQHLLFTFSLHTFSANHVNKICAALLDNQLLNMKEKQVNENDIGKTSKQFAGFSSGTEDIGVNMQDCGGGNIQVLK